MHLSYCNGRQAEKDVYYSNLVTCILLRFRGLLTWSGMVCDGFKHQYLKYISTVIISWYKYIYIFTPYLGPKMPQEWRSPMWVVFHTRGTGCGFDWTIAGGDSSESPSRLPQVVQDFSDHCDLSRPLRKQFLGSMSDIVAESGRNVTLLHLLHTSKILKACRFGTAWTCLDFWDVWKGRGDCCHLWWLFSIPGLGNSWRWVGIWHLFGLVGTRKHSHSPKKFCCCHGDVQSASGTSRPKVREWLGRTVGWLMMNALT